MKISTKRLQATKTSALRDWWADHGTTLLRLAVALMAILALLKLGDEFRRLLWETGHSGAIDLLLRHQEVHRWFAGQPVYSEIESALYPPASYVMLWPAMGWLAATPARWLWAITSVGSLVWLARLVVRKSQADTLLERIFVALMPLAMNATGVTIGNGQLILHLLPMLLAGLLLLRREKRGWPRDLLAAALILAAMVKPSVTAPFFWIVLFSAQALRVVMLIGVGYVGLTLLAAQFQEPGLWDLLQGWLSRASVEAMSHGYGNLSLWLSRLGLEGWILPASLVVLVGLGVWTYRHRRGDIWLLLGVAALVARFWTYHRLYDDLLILLPMITLFRIAKQEPFRAGDDMVAGALLALTVIAMMAPARIRFAPWPWYLIFTAGHVLVWGGCWSFCSITRDVQDR